MQLPTPRGELSEQVLASLRNEPTSLPPPPSLAAIVDDDFQVALWALQELAFRRIQGVDAAWEDEPSFLALRSALEHHQETVLRETLVVPEVAAHDAPAALVELIESAEGPSLSSWVETACRDESPPSGSSLLGAVDQEARR